jgi:hypothetical protein
MRRVVAQSRNGEAGQKDHKLSINIVGKGLRAERRSLNCKVKLPSHWISSRRKALQKELTCDVGTVVRHNYEPCEKPLALVAVDEQVGGRRTGKRLPRNKSCRTSRPSM